VYVCVYIVIFFFYRILIIIIEPTAYETDDDRSNNVFKNPHDACCIYYTRTVELLVKTDYDFCFSQIPKLVSRCTKQDVSRVIRTFERTDEDRCFDIANRIQQKLYKNHSRTRNVLKYPFRGGKKLYKLVFS